MFGAPFKVSIILSTFSKDAWPAINNSVSIGLWIGNPGDFMEGGTEVATDFGGEPTGYERQNVECLFGWSPTIDSVSNNQAITWNEALTYWGEVTHVIIRGNDNNQYLFYGPLVAAKEIGKGSIARFAVGELTVTLI